MEIVKHGTKYHELTFTCQSCGCVFTSGLRREMIQMHQVVTNTSEPLQYVATCPECGALVESDKPEKRTDQCST